MGNVDFLHFRQNKSLSDDTSEMLRLQGVGMLVRKAIGMATPHVTITHTKESVEVIKLEQSVMGKAPNKEQRVLDWEERSQENNLFGAVIAKAKRVQIGEVTNDFLKAGWASDVQENGLILIVLRGDTSKGAKGWLLEQVRPRSLLTWI